MTVSMKQLTFFHLLLFGLVLLRAHAEKIVLKERKGHCRNGINAFAKIEAENFDYNSGVKIIDKGSGLVIVGYINPGDVIGYESVHFEDGAVGIQMRMALNSRAIVNQVHLHLDTIKNPPFVTIDIGSTGSLANYTTLSLFLSYIPTGVHDLLFTFSKNVPDVMDPGVVDIDWFQFFRLLPQ